MVGFSKRVIFDLFKQSKMTCFCANENVVHSLYSCAGYGRILQMEKRLVYMEQRIVLKKSEELEMLRDDLSNFAYLPAWSAQLEALAKMALPEP